LHRRGARAGIGVVVARPERGPLPTPAELTEQARNLLGAWGLADRAAAVKAGWNPRLRTTAGRAFWHENRIELNPNLLQDHTASVAEVLAHEAAHLAAFLLYGGRIRPHGREWRKLMRQAGHRPAACHRLPLGNLRRRRYLYLRMCEPCGHRLIVRSLRYGRCHRCGRRGRWLVLRTGSGAQGYAALRALSPAEVRARCIMAPSS
jgi:SprT protein